MNNFHLVSNFFEIFEANCWCYVLSIFQSFFIKKNFFDFLWNFSNVLNSFSSVLFGFYSILEWFFWYFELFSTHFLNNLTFCKEFHCSFEEFLIIFYGNFDIFFYVLMGFCILNNFNVNSNNFFVRYHMEFWWEHLCFLAFWTFFVTFSNRFCDILANFIKKLGIRLFHDFILNKGTCKNLNILYLYYFQYIFKRAFVNISDFLQQFKSFVHNFALFTINSIRYDHRLCFTARHYFATKDQVALLRSSFWNIAW